MATKTNRITSPDRDLEQFVIDDVQLTGVTLGAGAYGSVEEVEIPGARVAAKKLHFHIVNLGSPQKDDKWVTSFVRECKLMSQLRHPHIVQFLGVAYLPGSPIPVLLMEKLQTSLDNLLETSPNIPLDVKVHLLTGTARGVVYLHSHTPPIAHRDLTARNILIDSGLTAKIADLGVARIVDIQPGQLAAKMTAGPGNNLYMPPETVQEEGATRYNTAIDIFSFGVVSLFTLTQTFPKDLKPATYLEQTTSKLIARSEIERRENYIVMVKNFLGRTHLLVKLILDCLKNIFKDRPSAVDVLRQLVEVGRTVPQSCTETKLELIWQVQMNQAERAKEQERICRLEELTTLQQQKLEVQHMKIEQLSDQIRSMELQPQKELPNLMVPLNINFSWKSHKDLPPNSQTYGQPIALNGKLYVRADSKNENGIVLKYTPDDDQWNELRPHPPVDDFTIATLRNQLLVVGGICEKKKTNTFLTFDEDSQQWIKSYPDMPKALARPFAIGYQDHLIVGSDTEESIPDVHVLDTKTKKWTASQPLPYAGYYRAILNEDTAYLTFQFPCKADQSRSRLQKTVLRAHVPTLISGAKSGVWETLPEAFCCHSAPFTIDGLLLTAGGSNKQFGDSHIASIHLYVPATSQWVKVGELPEPMGGPHCVCLSGELFILGSYRNSSVYSVKPYFTNAS